MKVFRNVELKGIISKKKALDLLGMNLEVRIFVKDIEISISRDDMGNVDIDYIVDDELVGGEFEEI